MRLLAATNLLKIESLGPSEQEVLMKAARIVVRMGVAITLDDVAQMSTEEKDALLLANEEFEQAKIEALAALLTPERSEEERAQALLVEAVDRVASRVRSDYQRQEGGSVEYLATP